jgi:hypothetical protein
MNIKNKLYTFIIPNRINMQEFDLSSGFNDMESIDIKFNDDEPRKVNFGMGASMLMNDKKRSSSSSSANIDLGELDNLEAELNELSGSSGNNSDTKSLRGFANNLFNFSGAEPDAPNDSNLGTATAGSVSGVTKSFDGFSKMNDIPVDFSASSNKISDREKRRKRRMMLKKIDEWNEKGLTKNSSHFNSDSSYEEIEDEYEGALEDKRKKDSSKISSWWMLTFVHSLEYANSAYDPFDINLDGWGESISEDLDNYDEIFSELHEKYKGGKIMPEISLLLRLGFSASVINFTNKALSSATPAFNDVIKQSPELYKMFTKATVQSMSQNSPGFNFANTMINKDEQTNTSFGPPPAPVETKLQPPSQRPPPMSNMQFTQRPDITAARSSTPMFRESGIDINNNQENLFRQETTPIVRNQTSSNNQRPEMRGPQNMDINGLLSGLKVNEIKKNTMNSSENENDSIISISSMRDMMGNQSNKPPKKNSRRKSSEKNTISLDI